jgi:two-component system, NarL family, sensor histidine kinase DesK
MTQSTSAVSTLSTGPYTVRMRLLPPEPFARLAYLWLVYLASPIYFAVTNPHDALEVSATIVAVAVFLPVYFWASWLRGPIALVPIIVITAIAILLERVNYGSGVFFVYAGAFAFRVGRPRVAVAVLGAIELTVLVDALLGGLDLQTFAWTTAITALVGGMVIYSADAGRRMYEAQKETARLAVVAERERIGRDLHDLLGHTLSVIALKSELASRLASADPDRSVAEIRDVERISRDALAEVRHAVEGWADEHGLANEIQRARTALNAAGVALACDVTPATLEPALSQTLAFALREAVTNVVRHAHATQCTIRIETVNPTGPTGATDSAGGAIRLSVEDDGIGSGDAEGSGLAGMRARVAARGGRLVRESGPGTRLTITLPAQSGIGSISSAGAA